MTAETMVKIKQDYWLPLSVRIVLYVFLLLLMLVSFSKTLSVGSYLLQGGLFLLCLAAVTARNFLEVNKNENNYREYTWIAGLKFGETTNFRAIEKLFINKINLVSEAKYTPIVLPNPEVRTTVYKCFLKFDDGEKIVLDTDANKDKLITRLKGYNTILKTALYDTTEQEPVRIE